MNSLRLATLLGLALSAVASSAAPLVSYSVSGAAGAYVLDFSVTNTLGGTNDIYFFGVEPPTATSSPSGWIVSPGDWSNAIYGGSDRIYASNWFSTSDPESIRPGSSLSGFQITVSSLPVGGVNWFAYAFGGSYTGGDAFSDPVNPGFEGTAYASSVPGPFAALPFALMALRRRKRGGCGSGHPR